MRVLPTIKWFFRSWPISIPAILVLTHYFTAILFDIELKSTNRAISLGLQVFGGLLVLYSIDSNLGVVGNKSLSNILVKWLKAFPPTAKPITITLGKITEKGTVSPIKARTGCPGTTTEEHLAYLQKQINWLEEDQIESFVLLEKKMATIESNNGSDLASIRSSLGLMNNKLTDVSVGGIKLQIFGVILVIYGSVVSYLT